MKALICMTALVACVAGQEMWYNVGGTKFEFDKYFRKNLNQ